jgi:hypothetical protein
MRVLSLGKIALCLGLPLGVCSFPSMTGLDRKSVSSSVLSDLKAEEIMNRSQRNRVARFDLKTRPCGDRCVFVADFVIQ